MGSSNSFNHKTLILWGFYKQVKSDEAQRGNEE